MMFVNRPPDYQRQISTSLNVIVSLFHSIANDTNVAQTVNRLFSNLPWNLIEYMIL